MLTLLCFWLFPRAKAVYPIFFLAPYTLLWDKLSPRATFTCHFCCLQWLLTAHHQIGHSGILPMQLHPLFSPSFIPILTVGSLFSFSSNMWNTFQLPLLSLHCSHTFHILSISQKSVYPLKQFLQLSFFMVIQVFWWLFLSRL